MLSFSGNQVRPFTQVIGGLFAAKQGRRIMVTIRLIHGNSGKPIKGKKVALGISGLLSGGVTKGEWTDSNGEVHFDVRPNYGKVYVDGSTRYEGHLSGRVIVYV